MLRYRFQRSSSFKKKKSHPFVTYNLTSIHISIPSVQTSINQISNRSLSFPLNIIPQLSFPNTSSNFQTPPLQLSSRNLSIVKDEEGLVAAYRLARRGDSADHLQS